MDTRRNRRIDRATAEQLLAGDPTVDGALARLLGAAAAPTHGGELAGEDAAAAMWRAAGRRPAPAVPHRRWRTRLATVKIITAGAVVGVGGVALAASAGVFTGPPQPARPTAGHSPTASTGTTTVQPTPSSGSGSQPGRGPDRTPAAASTTHPTPAESAALTGLCHAYTAATANGHADVLNEPAYAPLIIAAGGRDQVASFCAALVATTPGPAPGHTGPTPAPHPSTTPAPRPSSGSGKGTPAGGPSGNPTTHPDR